MREKKLALYLLIFSIIFLVAYTSIVISTVSPVQNAPSADVTLRDPVLLNFTLKTNVTQINETYIFVALTENNGTIHKHGLVFLNLSTVNNTNFTYLLTTLPIFSDNNTLGLLHLDNLSSFTENSSRAFDFSNSNSF